MDPNSTDALFAIIRKELNTIVESGEKKCKTTNEKTQHKICLDKENPDSQTQPNITKDTQSPRIKTTNNLIDIKKSSDLNSKTTYINQRNNRIKAGEGGNSVKIEVVPFELSEKTEDNKTKLIAMKEKFKSTLEKDIAHQTSFLNSPRTKTIDADIQRMQMELQDSYNLFQGISEKFEAINFSHLQKRIKELNLSNKRDVVGTERAGELKSVIEEGFKTNRLSEMTTKVGEKFSKHPGEFGNIPELSSFFQACTQLEHVLINLKRQRNDVRDLENRMRKSAEISYNRVKHIKKQLLEKKLEEQSIGETDIDI